MSYTKIIYKGTWSHIVDDKLEDYKDYVDYRTSSIELDYKPTSQEIHWLLEEKQHELSNQPQL